MKRIFYSDYGAEPSRLQRIEALLRHLKDNGAAVCRTSRHPIESVALTLPLPNFLRQSTSKQGLTLGQNADPKNQLLRIAGQTLNYDVPKRGAADCYASAYLYKCYIEEELSRFEPDLVILWHQFNAYHYIIAAWCRRNNVPVIYGENGVLPGSWCFEFGGQMAESWIAREPSRFAALPIDGTDIAHAQAYLEHARRNRLSRKTDMTAVSESDLSQILAADPRPKILYAGINDYKTGLQPYTTTRTPLHAADFISTEQGLQALLRVARRNNWYILYKPHPSTTHAITAVAEHEEYLTLIDKRIDLLDLLPLINVLTTIVSQSAYMSVMHERPTVIMGKMQLSGSGLVREALFNAQLESAVKKSIADGSRKPNQRRLLEHIARLLKFYVISPEFSDPGLFKYSLSDFARSLLTEMPSPACTVRA
ncbi:hypothetical protein [Xanthobacter agilis]|uniref:Uncharacterized protein n=1 Tax=Xanthobacter agilis TaxID=47492 RepID=A0ABU0LHJ3_XANAG|nr:hypothetical protein [Xanthobacter agilis]MDQ0506619.1 hypothetical protein [Xanthobacter agilis]